MPDLITHSAAAFFLTRHKRAMRYRAFFYIGAILPDVLARPVYIVFPKLFFFPVAVHTPVFMLATVLLFSEFFRPEIKRPVVQFTLSGVALHFLMDFFQRHLLTGYYWFFPFSWKSIEIPLFWPETPVRFIPLWIALVLGTELISIWRRRTGAREGYDQFE